jgi:hypothetical protein
MGRERVRADACMALEESFVSIRHKISIFLLRRIIRYDWGLGTEATVRNRTGDILITSEVLYQLSYGGLNVF